MKTITHSINTKIVFLSMLFAFLFIAPIKHGMASGGGASYDVNLPIAEIQGLIQQLQDVANQVAGEAGIQIRATVDEISDQMRQRIDQIHTMASDIIKEVSAELKAQIDNLMKQARALLKEINTMVQQNIQCINQVLAERISQIKDSILDIIDKVDATVKNAIDRIYVRATMLTDTGANRVAIVVNNTFMLIAKIVLLILCFIILFWIIRMLWSNNRPSSKFIRIVIPIFALLLLGAGIYLILNNKILAKIVGVSVPVPNWEESCNKGDSYYSQFMQQYSTGTPKETLKSTGKMALEQLNWCLYASVSPEVGTETTQKIQEISTILYPPANAPSSSGGAVVSNCGGNNSGSTGGIKVDPGWFSKYNYSKLATWNLLIDKGIVKQPKVNPDDYKTSLNKLLSKTITINEVIKTAPTVKPSTDKMNMDVVKMLQKR